MRRVPSLRGLQAFEAVARTRNLAAAAEWIGITPSAVSHRIRGLEEELGIQLLQRAPRGLSLTEAGHRYRGAVEDAFALLSGPQLTSSVLTCRDR
jgi:LysR family glycine cleavage system transcriptional activator